MARPTKLTDRTRTKASQYVAVRTEMREELPTIEGLALELSINRETLYEWEKVDKSFSDIMSRLRQVQANKLIQNGLTNRYNSTIAKLILSKHDYVEKTEQDTRHSGEVSFNNAVPRPRDESQG